MRTLFANTITELARKNPKIILLTGDLGYSVFETFEKEMPSQFLNMGVAEQNMTGVAAGLAMEGFKPIIYSIVPFVTMRNFEQIRNDICYQDLDVKIVGVGAGFSYGPYGHTHHALEDVSILRAIPNMTILSPGDPAEALRATKAMMDHVGPVYMRLGKDGMNRVHESTVRFSIGKGILVQDGIDITLISTSTMLERAVEVAGALGSVSRIDPPNQQGSYRVSNTKKILNTQYSIHNTVKPLSVRIISMPTIKPLDTRIILESARQTRAIFTLEEHSIVGGLGSAVAEVLAESSLPSHHVLFHRIGVADRFTQAIGLSEFMKQKNGLSATQIVKTIQTVLQSGGVTRRKHDKK